MTRRHFYFVDSVAAFLMRSGKGSSTWCKACGYSGHNLQDVVRHVEAKHLNLEYRCKFCDLVTRTRLNLTRHLKRNHVNSKSSNFKEILHYHFQA